MICNLSTCLTCKYTHLYYEPRAILPKTVFLAQIAKQDSVDILHMYSKHLAEQEFQINALVDAQENFFILNCIFQNHLGQGNYWIGGNHVR